MNDQINFNSIENADKIVLSPGPGLPQNSGRLMEVIEKYHLQKPILGVCLGMQAIAIHFNIPLINLNDVKHGIQENIQITQPTSLFYKNTPLSIPVGLYHSWAVADIESDNDIVITSRSENGVNMSLEHKTLPIYGVQFHPESILTPNGKQLLQNFLEIC